MSSAVSNYLLKALAEFFGTAILVFVGCMGCVFGLGETREAGLLNTSIGFGLAVMMCVQTFGCVSQAHVNPSVTLACLMLNLISIPMACVYVVAQICGSLVGYGILKALTPIDLTTSVTHYAGVCTTVINPYVSVLQGIFVEFMITGILIFVVCGAFNPRNSTNFDSVSIRFGLTIWGLALVASPYTGASMNPARSLGPAVWNGYYRHIYVYWIGPLCGSATVSFIYKMAFIRYCPPPPKMLVDDEAVVEEHL